MHCVLGNETVNGWRRAKPSCKSNEQGSVTVETTFSLFIFAILFLFMLYFYEILETQTALQIDSGIELRQKMIAENFGCYASVSVDNVERISLQYNLDKFIPAAARSFEAKSKKVAYTGSCPGTFMSRFDGVDRRRARQPN